MVTSEKQCLGTAGIQNGPGNWHQNPVGLALLIWLGWSGSGLSSAGIPASPYALDIIVDLATEMLQIHAVNKQVSEQLDIRIYL